MSIMLLRVAVIVIMILVVVWVCHGIYRVARPLFAGEEQSDATILVESFDLIQDGKVERGKGDVIAQLVATRIRQIEETLAKKPDLSRFQTDPHRPRLYLIEGSIGGDVGTIVIKSSPLSIPRDLELKVYGVDVGGILGFFQNKLHEGPRLKGLLKLGADKHEILMTLEGRGLLPEAGVWMVSAGNIQDVVDTVSHKFVLDTRRRGNPQLGSLSDEQFVVFLEGVASYLEYFQKYNTAKLPDNGREHLLNARRILANLVDTRPVSPLPYMYLASVRTLLDEKDIAEPLKLLQAAITIAPDDLFIKEQIARLEAANATRPGKKQHAVTLLDIQNQPAFQFVNLPVALSSSVVRRTIKVAILATGIDATQQIFSDRIVAARSFVPEENDSNDLHGYGTHVAGLVLAAAPEARIVNVKVLSKEGTGSDSSILEGIEFAMEQKPDIMLLSFGSPAHSKVYETVIHQLVAKGILVIAPAGNDSADAVNYPAGYEGVLSVGATDLKGSPTQFSNFGSRVKIFAPGVEILSLLPGHQSSRWNGTSMSSAITAGVAALILAANKGLVPIDASRVLMESSQNLSGVNIIDAAAALQAASKEFHRER